LNWFLQSLIFSSYAVQFSIMPLRRMQDVDTPEDLDVAEFIFKAIEDRT
jgi:CMP-N-acetylneuraminic acid synthetase